MVLKKTTNRKLWKTLSWNLSFLVVASQNEMVKECVVEILLVISRTLFRIPQVNQLMQINLNTWLIVLQEQGRFNATEELFKHTHDAGPFAHTGTICEQPRSDSQHKAAGGVCVFGHSAPPRSAPGGRTRHSTQCLPQHAAGSRWRCRAAGRVRGAVRGGRRGAARRYLWTFTAQCTPRTGVITPEVSGTLIKPAPRHPLVPAAFPTVAPRFSCHDRARRGAECGGAMAPSRGTPSHEGDLNELICKPNKQCDVEFCQLS